MTRTAPLQSVAAASRSSNAIAIIRLPQVAAVQQPPLSSCLYCNCHARHPCRRCHHHPCSRRSRRSSHSGAPLMMSTSQGRCAASSPQVRSQQSPHPYYWPLLLRRLLPGHRPRRHHSHTTALPMAVLGRCSSTAEAYHGRPSQRHLAPPRCQLSRDSRGGQQGGWVGKGVCRVPVLRTLLAHFPPSGSVQMHTASCHLDQH